MTGFICQGHSFFPLHKEFIFRKTQMPLTQLQCSPSSGAPPNNPFDKHWYLRYAMQTQGLTCMFFHKINMHEECWHSSSAISKWFQSNLRNPRSCRWWNKEASPSRVFYLHYYLFTKPIIKHEKMSPPLLKPFHHVCREEASYLCKHWESYMGKGWIRLDRPPPLIRKFWTQPPPPKSWFLRYPG